MHTHRTNVLFWMAMLLSSLGYGQIEAPWLQPGDSLVPTTWIHMPLEYTESGIFFLKHPDEINFEFKSFLKSLTGEYETRRPPIEGAWVSCYGTGIGRKGGPWWVNDAWQLYDAQDNGLMKDELWLRNIEIRFYPNRVLVMAFRDPSRAQRGHSFGYLVEMPSEIQLSQWTKRLNAIDQELIGKIDPRQKENLLVELQDIEEKSLPALMARWYALEAEVWQQAFSAGQWVHPDRLPIYVEGTPWDSIETQDLIDKMVLPAHLNYRYQLKAVYVVDRDEEGKVVNTQTQIRIFEETAEPLKDFWEREFGDSHTALNHRFFRNELTIELVEKRKHARGSRRTLTKYHLTRKNKISE